MKNNKKFLSFIILYSVALTIGLSADLIFPGYKIINGTTIFYGTPTGLLTLLNLAVLFIIVSTIIF